jgi:hypothetical protein
MPTWNCYNTILPVSGSTEMNTGNLKLQFWSNLKTAIWSI